MQLQQGRAVHLTIDVGELDTVTNYGSGTVYYGQDYGTSPANYAGTIPPNSSVVFVASIWLSTDMDGTTVDLGTSTILRSSDVVHGFGPPTVEYSNVLYVDDLSNRRYWNGDQVAFIDDLSGLPDPLPPAVSNFSVVARTGNLNLTGDMAGYFNVHDTTGTPTLTLKSASTTLTTGAFFDWTATGPSYVVLAADSDVTVSPPLPLVLPAGTTMRVVCKAAGSYVIQGGVLGLEDLPVNIIAPVMAGTARTGNLLTLTSPGAWTQRPYRYDVQWQRDLVDIPGEVALTYKLVVADETKSMTCKVTATGGAGQSVAGASSNALVSAPVAVSLPGNSVLPLISGSAVTTSTLSVTDGTWTNNPTGYTRQWKRNGANIAGATNSTYTLVTADEGTTITVTVTATNGAGSTPATSVGVLAQSQAAAGDLASILVSDVRSFASGTPFAGQGLAYGGMDANSATEVRAAGGWNGDWMFNPRTKSNSIRSGAAKYIQPAGGVYEITGRNTTLCKVEVANIQGFVRYDDGTWAQLVHRTGVSGYANLYPEDWGTAAPGNGAKSITVSTTASGTTTCLLGTQSGPNNLTTTNGLHYLFHFWSGFGNAQPSGGRPFSTIAGVFACCRIRLDPATYDPNAKYVAYMGCDAYASNNSWQSDMGIGRLKRVDQNWRLFTMTTAPKTAPMPNVTGVLTSSEYR